MRPCCWLESRRQVRMPFALLVWPGFAERLMALAAGGGGRLRRPGVAAAALVMTLGRRWPVS